MGLRVIYAGFHGHPETQARCSIVSRSSLAGEAPSHCDLDCLINLALHGYGPRKTENLMFHGNTSLVATMLNKSSPVM